MPIVSKSEYARMCECSPANISKQLDRLKDALVDQDGKEMIDSDIADKILNYNRDTAKARGTESKNNDAPVPGSLDDIRRQQARAKLESELLDLAHRKGELLNKSETAAALTTAGTKIFEHMMAFSRPFSEQASTMTDAREINAMFVNEIRALFGMISNDLERIADGKGGQGQFAAVN